MSTESKIYQYKLDTEFSDGITTHTTRLQQGQRITTPRTTWKREKKLGTGAFGIVWSEREEQSGELRAVKVLSKMHLNVREVEALVALQDVSLHHGISNISSKLTRRASIRGISSPFRAGSKIHTRSTSRWNSSRTAIWPNTSKTIAKKQRRTPKRSRFRS